MSEMHRKMLIFLQIVLMKYVRIWHWFMDFIFVEDNPGKTDGEKELNN